jgi:hypothetical protein
LGGRFCEQFDLADNQPIQHLTLRVLYPSSRTISIKTANTDIQPQLATLGNETEYFWERQNVPAIDYEDSTPGWFDPYPTVSVSEFQNWADVVQWAGPLYRLPAVFSSKLAARIEGWKTQFASPAERAIAALRFVQDEIRYLGIEMGPYSHQPTAPDKVFSRRFGDCKDKSFLLVAMLNSMGIDAAPALVNSKAGRALDSSQPSPYAFDHVIVQTAIDGKTYWLDPTESYERGGLQQYYDPPFERALVIRQGKSGLDDIPLPVSGSGSTVIDERYDSGNSKGSVILSVTTTYQGSDADSMRFSLSTRSLADVGKYYLNFYAEYNTSIKADGLPQIDDDQSNNRIVVREKYLIDGFWKDGKHRFIAERVGSEINKPRVSQRSMPLNISYPLSITQRTLINLSESYKVEPQQITIANEAMKFDYSCSNEGGITKLEYSLQTLAESVPVNKIPEHLQSLDRMQSLVGFELSSGPSTVPVFTKQRPRISVVAAMIGFVLFPAAVLLSILLVRRKRKTQGTVQSPYLPTPKRGSTPETAIRVSTEHEIDQLLVRFKCRCGHRPYKPGSPPVLERFRYDGQLLIGMRLNCESCSHDSDIYINLTADKSELVELGLNSIESTRQ